MPRLLVLGLDSLPASLAFGPLAECLPSLTALGARGMFAPLRSTTPPITVPAWACMFSGRDPGELGLYGFRNRARGSYTMALPSSRSVTEKRAWDWLGEAGHRVAVLFVPPGHPPPPVRGVSASCFLHPGDGSAWTFPSSLGPRLEATHGPYRADAVARSGEASEASAADIAAMTRQHFAITRTVWREEKPAALFMVDIGPDRFHHTFYRHLDPGHPRHDPAHPMVAEARRYYRLLDEEVGRTVAEAGEDTHVLVVSDHGVRPLLGGVRVNQCLLDRGLLALLSEPEPNAPLGPGHIDWKRTRAFAEGGYYARVCVNLAGRDPEGIVRAGELEALLAELTEALEAAPNPVAGVSPHRVVRPDHAYRAVRGVAPDLMAFFGDLAYRALGTLDGRGGTFDAENDRGHDDANHDWHGVFLAAGPSVPTRGRTEALEIFDVARTCLGIFGVAAPSGLLGRDARD